MVTPAAHKSIRGRDLETAWRRFGFLVSFERPTAAEEARVEGECDARSLEALRLKVDNGCEVSEECSAERGV